MSETHEIAEKIAEVGEHGHAHAAHLTPDAFRRRMGLAIGVLACALAITSVGGSKAMQQTINANIESSDDYAFYQAKTLRKQVTQVASDEFDTLMEVVPDLPPDAAQHVRARQAEYAKLMAHWDSAPSEGNGLKELLAKAEAARHSRELASERNEWFEFAEAILQIAVVVASTSVLTASRPLAWVCFGFAIFGCLCSFNGFFGLIPSPFG